jgi:hypothetical protein
VLAGRRRGQAAECISRLGVVADILLEMGALPVAAFILVEQAEESGRSGDVPIAARAAGHLEEIFDQIDRPLSRAVSALGAAWSHLSTGAAPLAADAPPRMRSLFSGTWDAAPSPAVPWTSAP